MQSRAKAKGGGQGNEGMNGRCASVLTSAILSEWTV